MKKIYPFALIALCVFLPSTGTAQTLTPTLKNHRTVNASAIKKDIPLAARHPRHESGDASLKARKSLASAVKPRGTRLSARIGAVEADPNAPIINGFNYTTGDYRTPTTLPAGVYSFAASSPINLTKISGNATFPNEPTVSFYANGFYYMLTTTYSYDADYNPSANTKMVKYNVNTWQQVGDTINLGGLYPMTYSTAAYNPVDNETYMTMYNNEPIDWDSGTFPPSRLVLKMNMDTYKVDTIAKTDDWYLLYTFDSEGNVYAGKYSGDGNKLTKLDPSTNTFTEVGTLNLPLTTQGGTYTVVDNGNVYVSMHDGEFTTSLWKGTVSGSDYSRVGAFPGSENIHGMYITPADDPKAPSVAQDIAYTWDDSRTNLTLTYTVPTKAYDGSAVTGPLTVVRTLDGADKTFTADAGSKQSETLALSEGEHNIKLVVKNAAGSSQVRSFKVVAGQDVPGEVDSLTYAVDPSTGNDSLSWKAPKTSLHGGVVDDNTISYRVVRQPDNVVVAESQKATTFAEKLPTKRASYYYEVTSLANGKAGATATTDAIAYGDHYEVPFTEDFHDENASSIWRFADANSNNMTWGQLTTGYSWGLSLSTSWDAQNDYAFTPAISNLKADRDYELKFKVSGGTTESPVEYGVYLVPNLQDVSTWKLLLDKFSETDVKTANSLIIRVPKDGSYYLAFQGYCPTHTSNDFVLSDISMVEDALHSAPDTVTALTVTPGDKGALNGKLSFVAPVKSADGTALSSLSKVVVYDEGQNEVKTFDSVTPGSAYSYDFTTDQNANKTFYVRAFKGEEKGVRAEVTKFIGVDIPNSIHGLKVSMPQTGKATLTWNAVSTVGKNGGYVNPDDVVYRIVRWNENMYSWEDVADNVKGTSFTDETLDYSQAQQVYTQYGVYPSTVTGEGAGIRAAAIIGTPYAQPFKESFAHVGLSSLPWVLHNGTGSNGWNVIGAGSASVDPFDKDGGELTYVNSGTTPTTGYIQTPRIDLTANNTSALSFYMYHGAEADEGDAYVSVFASVDDADTVCLGTFQYNDGTDGWHRHVIDLHQYAGKNNVTFQFYAYTADGSAALYIDNVRLDQFAAKDLAVETAGIPYRMTTGDKASQVTARVINEGSETSGSYTVDVVKNGTVVATQDGEPLAVNATKDFAFDVKNALTEAGDSANFQVRVNYDNDGKLQNNTSATVSVYLNGPKYPKATALTANESEGSVKLTWTAPETVDGNKVETTDPVTDDFDSYKSFIIDSIGDWTTYDADKQTPIYFGGPEVPHEFEPQAFQVWNRDAAGFQKFQVLQPHSGSQYLMAFSASDGQSTTLPNDNWLISPEITGGSDIDFWTKTPQAYGMETYEILYSTATMPEDKSDDEAMKNFIATFHKIAEGTVDFTDWQNRGYTLPEDASYFAIRHTTQQNGSELMIDDVTYTPLYGGTSDLTLKGYNIYRDGELIASSVTEPTFVDKVAADGNYTYRVSVVYAEGESILSEPVSVSVADGIATITSNVGGKFNVYGVDGALIRKDASSLRGLKKGVYIIGNKKVIVK